MASAAAPTVAVSPKVEAIQRAVDKAKRYSARAQPSTIATALEEVLRECRIGTEL